jgi:hypothetical protein
MYKYFKRINDKRVAFFNTTKCETCGAIIQAPNSANGITKEIPKFLRMGMVEWIKPLPEEGYYSEEMGQEACFNCGK